MADLSLDGLTLLTPIPGAAETYFVSAAADYRGTVTQLFTGRTLSATVALGLRSSGAAFDLQIASSEVLTANRALNIVLGDAARTLTVGASASVSGANTGDQTTVSGNAGTATALATTRAIYGNNFNGTAALAQIIASTFGGTGNGFTKFSGPTTAEKTFTLPDASATIARTDAAQTFTGNQTILGPIVNLSGSSILGHLATLSAIQLGGNGVIDSTTARAAVGALALRQNLYFDGTNLKYISTDFASIYAQVLGGHQFYVAPSGTAGANATPVLALTVLNGGWTVFKELAANPTTAHLAAGDQVGVYVKADKFVFAYNQAGTIKYIVFTLDGATATFTNSSSAP